MMSEQLCASIQLFFKAQNQKRENFTKQSLQVDTPLSCHPTHLQPRALLKTFSEYFGEQMPGEMF